MEGRRRRLFENRALRGVGTGNGEHNNTRSFMICAAHQIFVWAIKCRRSRCAARVAHMGEKRVIFTALLRKPEGKSHFEDLGVDGRVLLNY